MTHPTARPTAAPATPDAANGHEPAEDQRPPRDAASGAQAGRPTGGRAVRVTLGAEHGPAPAVTVEPGHAKVDGETLPVRLRWIAEDRARLEPEGINVLFLAPPGTVRVPPGVVRREVLLEGWRVVVEIEPAARAELRERASRVDGAAVRGVASELHAMIPGRVLSITVAVGDAVEAGQAVMIIEAMKMQNELRVPRAGVVMRIVVAEGGTVEVGDLLIALEPAVGPASPAASAAPTEASGS
jgi:biotin carboxyl carrier protein